MSQDIFVPTSSPEDALVSPLHTVTYITSQKASVEKAFVEGYRLASTGWSRPAASDRELLNPYFGFDESNAWECCAFSSPGVGANAQVRVIYVPDDTPAVRPELDGLCTGGATISFPMSDLHAHEKHMATLGMKSTMGVKEMEFTGPAGETYISAEILYPAPENIYLLGVKRPEIFVPVGPIDPATGIGGAAYSARNSANSDAIMEFLKDVLGYEIRRDVTFTVGKESALLLAEGVKERFVQAFAPGSSTGYLVLMDHFDSNLASPAPSLGAPNRGAVMWSFMTEKLDEVHQRAKAAGARVLSEPREMASPFLPGKRTLLISDPDSFSIEVCEA